MALWHTPKLLAIKLDGVEHAMIEQTGVPVAYYPMGDGEWRMQFRFVPEGAKRGMFGFSHRDVWTINTRITTLGVDIEVDEAFTEPRSDLRSLATGGAVGVATALGVPDFLAGLAGFSSLGSGEAVILKLTARDLPSPGHELRLLVKGTVGLCADLRPKLIEKRARENW